LDAKEIELNKTYTQHVLINNCRLVGYSRFLARIKFGVTGQESNPQSATIHSTIRCASAKK
jgi:hypothetical protein